MGIFDDILNNLVEDKEVRDAMSDIFSQHQIKRMPIKDAVKNAPESMGCYRILLGGKMSMDVKRAENLRESITQYYNQISSSNAGKFLIVEWLACSSSEQCRRIKTKWEREKETQKFPF